MSVSLLNTLFYVQRIDITRKKHWSYKEKFGVYRSQGLKG